VKETSVVTVAVPAPTDVESFEPPPAAPLENTRGNTVEITIKLGPDENGGLKLISATALGQDGRHSLPLRPLALEAPRQAQTLASVAEPKARGRSFWFAPLLILAALVLGFAVRAGWGRIWPEAPPQAKAATKSLAEEIIRGESQGDAKARNPHSSAAGLAQFVDGTWLDLVRRRRPDIAAGLSPKQILRLRADPQLARFMTDRYVEENALLLARRGLPATPGSLYLAHFAGPGGAAAILAAPENADAATVIANADRRAGVTREKILSGNPFMRNFTAKDLKEWAELKMQNASLGAGTFPEKTASSSD
jgi:hypothetical protein